MQSDLERREAQAAILTSRAFNQHQLKKHHVDTLKEEGVKRRKTKDTNIVSTLTSTEDGSSKDKTSKTVFIKWIASKSDNITESQLCNLLKPYGPIKSVHIVLSNTQPSISKTIKGLILFQSDQSALNCYQLLKIKVFLRMMSSSIISKVFIIRMYCHHLNQTNLMLNNHIHIPEMFP